MTNQTAAYVSYRNSHRDNLVIPQIHEPSLRFCRHKPRLAPLSLTALLPPPSRSVYNMVKGMGSKAMTQTVINSLGMTAMMLPMTVIGLAGMIDGTWTIATERADEAGALLAELLLRREQGARPVTLVGFSMGSRLIFSCLKVRQLQQEPNTVWTSSGEDVLR